jgi:hypothetical protein
MCGFRLVKKTKREPQENKFVMKIKEDEEIPF